MLLRRPWPANEESLCVPEARSGSRRRDPRLRRDLDFDASSALSTSSLTRRG